MKGIIIRTAEPEDIPAITRIYNHAVLHTTATFDTVPKTDDDRLEWLDRHNEHHPVLVAVKDGEVVGWADVHQFGKRPAYMHTVENAIYIAPECQGLGIGSILLGAILDSAARCGHHVVLALIVGGNTASERLHQKFGFQLAGKMSQVGWKFDQWLDVLIYEKILDEPIKQ